MGCEHCQEEVCDITTCGCICHPWNDDRPGIALEE